MIGAKNPLGLAAGDRMPSAYRRGSDGHAVLSERDVHVSMRDGVELVLDVYRPDAPGKFPVLLALGVHPKDIQGPEFAAETPPQPSWSSLWIGHIESGDTEFFVSRGYVHVVANPRGVGKSGDGGSREFDGCDLLEWIAAQAWCDGNIGMAGIGAFASEQFMTARQRPPQLKTIFAFDPRGAYGTLGGFRDEYPGGVLHVFRYLIDPLNSVHGSKGAPGELPPEKEARWQEAMANPDYRMYPHIFNVIAQRGQQMPRLFDVLIDPYDREEVVAESEAEIGAIDIPVFTGAAWYGYTYKTHVLGAQSFWSLLPSPNKRLLFAGPSHFERPLRGLRDEMLAWYDHWLKGLDTGAMDEPPVRYWLMGANEWRAATDWPLPETAWTKLYLSSWERLTPEPWTEDASDAVQPPDAFAQMPPTQTNKVASLRYLTDPLPHDVEIAGPIVLELYAAIDQDDTNWIVALKDVGPDPSVRTAREGEREIPDDLPEREVSRGWLKASNRALDPDRSTPWKPWHPLTRAASQKVTPGEVVHYSIEILASANMFRRGHRICVEIACLDIATGTAGASNVEYIPYHIGSNRIVLHKVFHDLERPSHLLLPVIPLREPQ